MNGTTTIPNNDGDQDMGWRPPSPPGSEMDRRKFLELSMAAAVVAATGGLGWAADKQTDIPRRKLGRTGEMVSMVGLGGFHLGLPSEETSIRIVRTAIDNGMNF